MSLHFYYEIFNLSEVLTDFLIINNLINVYYINNDKDLALCVLRISRMFDLCFDDSLMVPLLVKFD